MPARRSTSNANVGTLADPVYAQSLTGSGQAGLSLGLPVRVNGLEGELALQSRDAHFNIDAVASYTVSKIENGWFPATSSTRKPDAIVLPAAAGPDQFLYRQLFRESDRRRSRRRCSPSIISRFSDNMSDLSGG